MPRQRTSKFTWAVLILIIGMAIWFAWTLFFLHVEEPGVPVSASKATSFASIPIPAQAINIRIAGYYHWIQYEQYVRFEAPTAVCLQTAAKILPSMKLQPADPFDLARHANPVRQDVFHDFSWLDLPKATNVIGAGGGPSVPAVWVDQDRGVFYYRKTD